MISASVADRHPAVPDRVVHGVRQSGWRGVVRRYIKSVGSDRIGLPNPDDASLDELVTALERFFDV